MVRLGRVGYTWNWVFNDLRLSLLEISTNGSRLAFSYPAIILPNPRHEAVLEQAGTMARLKRAPVAVHQALQRRVSVLEPLGTRREG